MARAFLVGIRHGNTPGFAGNAQSGRRVEHRLARGNGQALLEEGQQQQRGRAVPVFGQAGPS